ncbi:sensor domain-containing diguanylate cyclase [Bacillus massilinigeriensis]|uniref:sensor domain-containing diguanylate cyclase n=1 Tax=Bacillus massilionigeriensis TaxID=1805475 RepID=UPI00096B5E9D|nr:sensor domain-containing diguanylate cyclase [Bacillus massilionigeriensis]
MGDIDRNQKLISSVNNILLDIENEKFSVDHPALRLLKNEAKDVGMEGINELEEHVISLHKKIESLHWLNDHLRILADFAQTCAKTLNEEVLLRKAYELVSLVMPTDAFYLAIYDEKKQIIHFPFLVDEGVEFHDSPLEFSEDNITSKVLQTKQTLHVKTKKDLRLDFDVFGQDDTNTCIFVPLIIDGHAKGVISAQCHKEFAYRKEHEELLLIIGNQVLSSIETARLYKKIFEMSLRDEMTGLGNFRAFHNNFSTALKTENSLALIMLDSDNLKGINDRFGHEVGDSYLIQLGAGMKSLTNEDVTAYRYAGDEFMFIMKTPTKEKVETLIKRLDEYLYNHKILVANQEIKVSYSAGTSYFPDDGKMEEDLKRKADKALYRAKALGESKRLVLYNEMTD